MNDKYIVYFISRTKKKMVNFIEKKLSEKGLTDIVHSYGNVLTALYENDGKMSMKNIVELTGKEKSTITGIVNKLIKLDYVKKVRCINDKRVSYVLLTNHGYEIKDKFNEISEEVYNTAYSNFTKKEKDEFLRLLKKLNNNFTV